MNGILTGWEVFYSERDVPAFFINIILRGLDNL